MPRESRVPLSDAVKVLKEFIVLGHFKDNDIPIKNSGVWVQMSLRFGSKWSARDVYREVREDRRQILTKAREEVYSAPVSVYSTINSSDMLLEDNIFLSDPESVNSPGSGDREWEAPGLETVLLPISEELFMSLHEREPMYYNKRKYTILERFKWASILAEKIYLLTYLPCSFVFKNCKIYPDEGSVHYLTLRGKCKSEVCGNKIFGLLDKKPSHFPCYLRIRTKDTFGEPHEDVRRPTRKFQRLMIGEQALNEGVGNYTKRQAALYAQNNKRLPPILPKQNIIRDCKIEFIHHKLGVKPGDGRDIVNTIEDMRNNPLYPEFIQDVKRDKFYVSYSTRNQLISYKRYCKLAAKPRVAIDGTGSIIRPITHPNGKRSGHIFLYAIVISFKNKTHSVHQLLTECQNTQTLIWWLKFWLAMGAHKPAEASCDSSRALINALSFAFNDQSIKAYVETLYLRAIGDTSHIYRPPIFTFIRLDVAHFIHMISEWKCLKNQKNSLVKRFYIYCVALMIDCQTVGEFRKIFRLICIVALNERDDSIIKITGKTVAQARHELKIFIATRDLSQILNKLESSVIISESKENNDPDGQPNNEPSDDKSEPYNIVKTFINNIFTSAKDIKILGKGANAYYADDFIREFLPRAYEFPLWTSSCFPDEVGHATTSHVEQFFGDKKKRSLVKWNSLMRADVFLKHEYEEYNCSSSELQSNLIIENERKDLNSKGKKDERKKNYDSLNHIFDEEKFVGNDSVIINHSEENIPFALEKRFEICSNEHLDSCVNNYSSCFFNDVEEPITNNCKDNLSNMSYGILLNSIELEDVTNEKLSFTITEEYNEKIIKDNYIEKKQKILDDSDLVAIDNWRNKGRPSHYDYYNSLNHSKENEEAPVKIFEKKVLASPKKSFGQKKVLNESLNLYDNKANILSSTPMISTHLYPRNKLENIWKNQENVTKIKQHGFHFQPTPDILYQTISPVTTSKPNTANTTKTKNLGILQNGNKRNPISVNGTDVLLFNTCAFDSLIHVLAIAGKDDPQFLTYMKENLNPTLKLICDFIEKGPIPSIYLKRTVILSQLFKDRIVKKKLESHLYSNELDMWSSICDMWTRCFPNSAWLSHVCTICGIYKISVPMVQVNTEVLWEGGFSNLQASILSTLESKIRCTKCRVTTINRSLLLNTCVCIELNVQKFSDYLNGPISLQCQLRDMPAIIEFNNLNYRLRGVIECEAGHFKAFCRRGQNYWGLYDDNAKRVTAILPSKSVTPDAAIYTRI